MVALSVRVAGFELATPIVLASGPAGFGTELLDVLDYGTVGALTTKTVTPEPMEGNRQPRLVDCAASLLNSIGLENPGFDAFVEDELPAVLGIPTRRIVSLAARRPDEIAAMASALASVEGVDALELNLSCPNTDDVMVGDRPRIVGEYVRAACSESSIPVLVKLPGDTGVTLAAAEAGLREGAAGLTLINSVRGMRIDHRLGVPLLHRGVGGLSGPAILPIALARVFEARRAFPEAFIIGTGGVTEFEDLVEMLAAGADAVGVGFGIMANPSLPAQLAHGLSEWLVGRGIESVAEISSAAHRGGFDVH